MAKKGWHGDSARHSLAARGIESKVVRRRTFIRKSKAYGLPLKLQEMTPAEASKIAQTNCGGCQEVIKEARKQKRMVVYNWESYDAVALGEKISKK